MKRAIGVLLLAVASTVGAAVPLPYSVAPSNAVDWTSLPGWSGSATHSSAGGYALFETAGTTLELALAGAPTQLSFSLRGYARAGGTASFVVEQSADGTVWNSTPVADVSDAALTVASVPFGPYPLLASTRFIRFSYADRYAYDVGLNHVAVSGGPAEPRVAFVDREDGFIVAQHAENETIAAAVINAGDYWFGSPALGKEAWESDNGGTYKQEYPKDVYHVETAATGTFYATANGRAENTDEIVSGTIHFTVAPAYAIEVVAGANGSATAQVNNREATNAPTGAWVTILPVPDEGHATESVTLNGEAIEGTSFAMPAEAARVEVAFRRKIPGEPTLIISQYYEGAGDNKWIELYNPGAETVELDAAGYRLGIWQNASREGWKTGTAPGISIALPGRAPPGTTYLVSHGQAGMPAYAEANVATNALVFNGDDSVALYTGTVYDRANAVDVFGLTSNAAANCSYVRKPAVVCGSAEDMGEEQWIRVDYASVDAADQRVPERLGWHAAGQVPPAPPPTLSNLAVSGAGIAFEIPTNVAEYTVYGASELAGGTPGGWAGSSIVDQCTSELAGNQLRITVPTTLGRRQMIWLAVPGTN